jgi:myo-inositol 2-dehydrogenase / D-chiro-inositol 1-dehydrogenase
MGAFRAAAVSAHPEVESVIVGSHDVERARRVAEPMDGRWGTIEEVLAEELDALVISTVTREHPEQIAAAVARGFPILCEKPISVELGDTERTMRIVDEANVELQIAFQRRFDPGFRRARDLVAGGGLGTVYSLRMSAHDHEPSDERYIPTSGGIFRDLHVHDFDMARWLTGLEAVEVYATGSVRAWERFARFDDVDTSAIVVTLAGGVPVLVSGSRHDPAGYDFRAEILGSEASVAVGMDDRTPLLSLEPGVEPPSGRPYVGFLDRFREAFLAETAAFVDLVHGRGPNLCPPAEALEALRVAEACDRSWRERRPVALAEIDIP